MRFAGTSRPIHAFDSQTVNLLSTPCIRLSPTNLMGFQSPEMICPLFGRNAIVLQFHTRIWSGFRSWRSGSLKFRTESRYCVSHSVANEIILNDDKFWIVSRQELFGPFDYQWSGDLYGIEFTYQGQKFGEVCSDEEFYADLKPFGLPISVARVAALVAGTIVISIRSGTSTDERVTHLISLLQQFDLARFSIRESTPRDP